MSAAPPPYRRERPLRLLGLPLRWMQAGCIVVGAGLVLSGVAALWAAWGQARTDQAAGAWTAVAGSATAARVEKLGPPADHFVVVLEYRYPAANGEQTGVADAPRQPQDPKRKEEAEEIAAQYRALPALEVFVNPSLPTDSRLEREPESTAILFLTAAMGALTLLGGVGLAVAAVLLLPLAATEGDD